MTNEEKLTYFDQHGFALIDSVNKNWLNNHLKKHKLVSPTDAWTDLAAIGLVDRYLRVEGAEADG